MGCLCVRKSSRKEEVTRTRVEPFVAALRVIESCPAELGQQQYGSEFCVVEGRPSLRSVNSESQRAVLSSPEILIAGASVVDTSGGRVDTPQWPGVFGPTGVQEQGVGTRGWLGNLRDPSVSTDISGSGTGIPTPRPTALRRVAGSKQDARVVSPNEGNEVRREGRTGVGASRSTALNPGNHSEGPGGGSAAKLTA